MAPRLGSGLCAVEPPELYDLAADLGVKNEDWGPGGANQKNNPQARKENTKPTN